jgi:hypothetical protein
MPFTVTSKIQRSYPAPYAVGDSKLLVKPNLPYTSISIGSYATQTPARSAYLWAK